MKSALFRFAFVYLGLYLLASQFSGGLLLVPGFSFPGFGTLWPMRPITIWIATHLFGITKPLVYTGNSGDTEFFWVQTCWLLVVSVVAAIVWSLAAGHRDYPELRKWFRFVVRLAVASQMLDYGMAKLIPTQFPPPSLVTLLAPVGSVSLQGLLWTTIGASVPYQVFTGCAEILSGVLLLVPRTATLGALVGLADMIQVFVLNMTYDIGLKQISFHLLLMTLFLLAPDFPRLARVLVLNRPAAPRRDERLFASEHANRIALGAQLIFGLYLIAMYASISRGYWYATGGGGSPKSLLYGIWDVEQLSVDGENRSPFENDYDRRWRRVVFDAPAEVAFERWDDSLARYGVSINVETKKLALTKGSSTTWTSTFTYEQPDPDRLVLDGEMDEHAIHAELQRVNFDTFRLLNSGFRWIRPPDTAR